MPKNTATNSAETPCTNVTRKTFITGVSAVAITGILVPTLTRAETVKTPPGRNAKRVEEIAEGIFVHTGDHDIYTPQNAGDISNASFVVGTSAVAVIDTGGTFQVGNALREIIRKTTDRPIKYVINTHMHPDHVLGNAAFKPDAPQFVAHHKMGRGLAARAKRYIAVNRQNAGEDAFAGTEIVQPTHPVKSRETIDLGGRVLTLEPQPTAHTDNDLVITDEKTKTLFLGDLLFSEHCPALDGSILGWLRVLEKLSKKDAQRVVPGHGPAAMKWPDAIEPQRRYLQAIVDDVRRLISEGKTLREAMELAAHGEATKWLLFKEFHQRNVSAAFAELEWE